jgi:hypothetical protein
MLHDAKYLFLMRRTPEDRMNISQMKRRVFKGLAVLATLGVFVVGALTGVLYLEHRSEVTLPAPTGPFAVGRALFDWVDDGTLDASSPAPGSKRELLVWIWYPAA